MVLATTFCAKQAPRLSPTEACQTCKMAEPPKMFPLSLAILMLAAILLELIGSAKAKGRSRCAFFLFFVFFLQFLQFL